MLPKFSLHKKYSLIILAISFFNCSYLEAQREQNVWYSGRDGIFVDFNSGSPIVNCTSTLFASEGSGMYCNPNTGELLVYTNGQIVKDSSGNNLTNGTGLFGNSSATETAMILPKLCGDLDEYWVLTNNLNRVYWSEADLSIGPNGTLDASTKNTLLQENTGERLGCAPHGNGNSGWILLTDTGGYLNAYFVDGTGINTTPIVSHTTLFNSNGSERGSIIISEDYSKLVISIEYQGVFFCDFDIFTGIASNFQHVPTSTNGFSACFSPDGTKIYWSNGYASNLYQYDIPTNTNTFLDYNMSGVKLGPDGVVYTVTYNVNFWGTITSPNTAGTGCNYTRNGLNLNGCYGSWNFPNQSINISKILMQTSNDTVICSGDPVTLWVSSAQPLSYSWDNGLGAGVSHTVNPTNTTVYYVTGTDTASCIITDSVIITVSDSTPPTSICKDTTVYLSALGNITIDSSYIENGSFDNCAIASISLNRYYFECIDIGPNPVTMYVTDTYGNVDSCNAIVTILDSMPPSVICYDTTLYLDTSGFITLDTSHIQSNSFDNCGIQNINISPATLNCSNYGANFVTLYVSDSSGNIDSCTSTVTILDTISPTPICQDTTIHLTNSGLIIIDSSFIDSGSFDNCAIQSITINRDTFTCADTGLHIVTLYTTDIYGNIDSCFSTVTILDTSSLISNAGTDDSICNLTSYSLNGSTPPFGVNGTWALISGPNTPIFSNINDNLCTMSGLTSGTYILEWVISNQCHSNADTVHIHVFDIPNVNAGNDTIICGLTNISLNGNFSTGTGTWSYITPAPSIPVFGNINSPTSTISNLSQGTYAFVLTVNNGNCPAQTDTVNFTVYDSSHANAGPDVDLCNSYTTALVANSIPVTATGLWSSISGPNIPTINTPNSSATSVTGLIQGTYLLTWSVSNGICPQVIDSVLINVYDLPISNAGSDTNLCEVYSMNLYGNQPTGTSHGTWMINPSSNPPSVPIFADSSQYNTMISNLVEGQYELIWIVRNGNCPPAIDTILINVWERPIANAGPDTSLCGTYTYQFSSVLSNPLHHGIWKLDTNVSNPNIPNINNPSSNNATVSGLIEGTYQFIWEAISGPCFNDFDTLLIHIYDPPISLVGLDQNLCDQDSTQINAVPPTGSSSGLWYLASSTPNSPSYNNSNSTTTVSNLQIGGVYSLYWEVTNGICAPSRDTITIYNHAIPMAGFTQDTNETCSGSCIRFTDTSSIHFTSSIANYYWRVATDTHHTANPLICWPNPGSFNVELITESAHGCRDTVVKNDLISVNPSPLADFNVYLVDDDIVSTKIQIQDNSHNSISYYYDLGDGTETTEQNPTHIYADSGFYDITQIVVSNEGCTDTLTSTINVHVLLVYVPNSFSPDGNGTNEIFIPYVAGDDPKSYLFRVYNRWGEMLFQSTAKEKGWNGTFKDKKCASDTYIWTLRTKYKNGERLKEYSGHVTVIR